MFFDWRLALALVWSLGIGRQLVLDRRWSPDVGELHLRNSRTEQRQRMRREMFVFLMGVAVSIGNTRRHDHPRVVIVVVAR